MKIVAHTHTIYVGITGRPDPGLFGLGGQSAVYITHEASSLYCRSFPLHTVSSFVSLPSHAESRIIQHSRKSAGKQTEVVYIYVGINTRSNPSNIVFYHFISQYRLQVKTSGVSIIFRFASTKPSFS